MPHTQVKESVKNTYKENEEKEMPWFYYLEKMAGSIFLQFFQNVFPCWLYGCVWCVRVSV